MANQLVYLFVAVGLIVGCGIQVADETQRGRAALLSGKADVAISHFERTKDAQPEYVVDNAPLRQSIWTYLGRAYYSAGRVADARDALTQGLKRDGSDFMARLYLGIIAFREVAPPPASKTDNLLALTDILFILKEKVSPRRVAALVKERGVSFDLNSDVEKELRRTGADDELIAQIRTSGRARPSTISSGGQQALRDIERALKETQSWHAAVRKAESSRGWDSRKLISTRIDASLAMIANKRTERPEFVSGLESIGPTIDEEVDLLRKK
jgi:tetratricopeptide (TPR) repeat protein